MLKHIVMWKFKDAEGKTKDENVEIVKNGLEALPPMIPHIKKLTFLKNQVECERNFDALLVVETENEEKLKTRKNLRNIRFILNTKRLLLTLQR